MHIGKGKGDEPERRSRGRGCFRTFPPSPLSAKKKMRKERVWNDCNDLGPSPLRPGENRFRSSTATGRKLRALQRRRDLMVHLT